MERRTKLKACQQAIVLSAWVVVASLGVISMSGCGETVKGASRDMKGFSTDASGSIKRADAWLTEHLW